MGLLGCSPCVLLPQALDVALLAFIFGTSLNDLRKQDSTFSGSFIAEVFIVLFAASTLGLTLWTILRQLMSFGSILPSSHDSDSDSEAGEKSGGKTSKSTWALIACLVANVVLWIWSFRAGNSTMFCTGIGISSSTCESSWTKIPFYIILVLSIVLQIVFLLITSFTLKIPFLNLRARGSRNIRHKLRGRMKKLKARRREKKNKRHRKYSIGKAERRESFEGDEMRGFGEWSSGSSFLSDDTDLELGVRGRSRESERRKEEGDLKGLSDEELAKSGQRS